MKLDYEKCKNLMLERWNKFCDDFINRNDNEIITDLCCSVISDESEVYKKDESRPKLDDEFCFKYRGFDFVLAPCTFITRKAELLNVTEENFKQRFPHGIFTDRYVCWMHGHRDIDGHTLQEYLKQNPDETENSNRFYFNVYLVPEAWSWGAEFNLVPGQEIGHIILDNIDKFIESKGIDNL